MGERKVRGKFQLVEMTKQHWSSEGLRLKFQTVYDSSTPEDEKFAKATPSGSIEMQVDNPSALAQFELGKYYYVDFVIVSCSAD